MANCLADGVPLEARALAPESPPLAFETPVHYVLSSDGARRESSKTVSRAFVIRAFAWVSSEIVSWRVASGGFVLSPQTTIFTAETSGLHSGVWNLHHVLGCDV